MKHVLINTQSRIVKVAATRVVDWLNGRAIEWPSDSPMAGEPAANDEQSRRRLEEIIHLMNDFTEEAAKVRHRGSRPQGRAQELLSRLNMNVARYPMVPMFLRDSSIDEKWRVGKGVYNFPGMTEQGFYPSRECFAVHSVILLAEHGLLNRIQKCLCGTWFFGRSGGQRSCSARCRHKRYERTAEFKEKRRKYMRDYMPWYYMMYQSPNAPRKKLTFQQWQKQDKRAQKGK